MINGKLIKVCGMAQGANIREVEKLGADLIGFIFYPKSARRVQQTPDYLPQRAGRVGVFVGAPLQHILEQNEIFHFDYLQLHGSETPAECAELKAKGFKLIKAISISCAEDLQAAEAYQGCCDYLLFDTRTPLVGGSGLHFDWQVLGAYKGPLPFLLSGGLCTADAPSLKEFHHPLLAGYDLNSRFELEPGVKNVNELAKFFQSLSNE